MIVLTRSTCPHCHADVIIASSPEPHAEVPIATMFESAYRRMLVLVSTPEIEGEKRIALGPCKDAPRQLLYEGQEAVIYFGHIKHSCIQERMAKPS